MKRVYIITGVGGHLGNTVARELLAAGETVRGFALPNEDVTMLYGDAVSIVRGDVRDKTSLEPLFYGLTPDDEVFVIHCAGIVSVATKYDQRVVDVNVRGTENVVALCKEHSVKKLVYISSVHALPELPQGDVMHEVDGFQPDTVIGLYAKTKAAATQIVLDAAKEGLNATVIQPSGIIGPNDYGHGHLTQMVINYLNGSLTACVEGGYDFVDVRDVADGVIAATEKGKKGECYILSNRYMPVRELLNTLSRVTGGRKITTVLPLWFAKLTAPLAELYYKIRHESPLFTRYTLYTLTSNARFTYEKAKRDLGYRPRDINTTIKDTVSFLTHERKSLFRKRGAAKAIPAMG
ncbi:MAG: NAD-dependent epimerase/dehydratase family protein [Eubacteriales bacterium]|nr:NAD-dependent epimerase/dehydratase family protein [Eubacteriales bacterium]